MDDEAVRCDQNHRHYDRKCEKMLPGTKFPSRVQGLEVLQRRRQARLAVSRIPFLEPLGPKRENYYQQKLLLGLPWYCPCAPAAIPDGHLEWTFRWDPPEGTRGLRPQDMKITDDDRCAVSFEDEAARVEHEICSVPGIICECCAGGSTNLCGSCLHATSFHCCERVGRRKVWCKGTLYGGTADYQRILMNLARKGLPTEALKTKADDFVTAGLLSLEEAGMSVKVIEGERGKERLINEPGEAGADASTDDRGKISERLTREEMQAELDKRVEMMRVGDGGDGVPDQHRVYQFARGSVGGSWACVVRRVGRSGLNCRRAVVDHWVYHR